eukprot:Clim_evm34s197 gene=Clim_evmTU34s197
MATTQQADQSVTGAPENVATGTEGLGTNTTNGSETAQTDHRSSAAQPRPRLGVRNLPREPMSKLKNRLRNLGVEFTKVMPMMNARDRFTYLSFENEEKRAAAKKILEEVIISGNQLSVVEAAPRNNERAIAKKRKALEEHQKADEADDRTPAEKINDKTAPLWRLSYEDQLVHKTKAAQTVLKNLHDELKASLRNADTKYREAPAEGEDQLHWLRNLTKENTVNLLEHIIPSPQINGYRNKSDFNLGPGPDGLPTVGFQYGLYREGSVSVGPASECPHMSDTSKAFAKTYQNIIRSSKLPPFDRLEKKGFWRTMLVREAYDGDCMVVAQVHPEFAGAEAVQQGCEEFLSGMSKAWESEIKALALARAKDGNDGTAGEAVKDVPELSVMVQEGAQVNVGFRSDLACKVLAGSDYFVDKLQGLKFRVSPTAFFQVNRPASNVLYDKIREFATEGIDVSTSVLFDVCCGTGTIGLAMAKSFKLVHGFEIVKDAIDDAKKNADMNGITNVEYHVGKAEETVFPVTQEHKTDKVVAVVDPPRAGLHVSLVRYLRTTDSIERLVFVSCDVKQAARNFVDLCRPPSQRFKGRPFEIKKIVLVDMFPHTNHFETVLQFERKVPPSD